MNSIRKILIVAGGLATFASTFFLQNDAFSQAQTPAAPLPGIVQTGPNTAPTAPPRPSAYPTRKVDPVLAEQGKGSFSVRCAFCHGSDARGGEGGPNLLRSELVLTDQNGEQIIPIVQHGREGGMPKFDLTAEQISPIVAFLHSLPISGNERGRSAPPKIPMGDPRAGKLAFDNTCVSCHSTTGDLKGIGSKIQDLKTLQQTWLMPGGRGGSPEVKAPQKTVTVTLAAGQKVDGSLVRIDDFTVTLQLADGLTRTIQRAGDKPLVQIHDPLIAHQKLLPSYTDKSIHDLTAYLSTVK